VSSEIDAGSVLSFEQPSVLRSSECSAPRLPTDSGRAVRLEQPERSSVSSAPRLPTDSGRAVRFEQLLSFSVCSAPRLPTDSGSAVSFLQPERSSVRSAVNLPTDSGTTDTLDSCRCRSVGGRRSISCSTVASSNGVETTSRSVGGDARSAARHCSSASPPSATHAGRPPSA
jgi:hypothetical protein